MDTTISTTGLMTEPGIRWEELSVVPSILVSHQCNALTLHSNLFVAIVSSPSMKSCILGFLPVYWCMSSISLVSRIIAVRFVNCRSLKAKIRTIQTCYPDLLFFAGLMVTASSLFHFLNFLNITIDIRNVCVFLAPLFSSLTVIVVYFLTRLVTIWHIAQCHVLSRPVSYLGMGVVCFLNSPVVTRYY